MFGLCLCRTFGLYFSSTSILIKTGEHFWKMDLLEISCSSKIYLFSYLVHSFVKLLVMPVSKVDVSVIRLYVHHQDTSRSVRHSDHRETQDRKHPGWEPTTSLRSINWVGLNQHFEHQSRMSFFYFLYLTHYFTPTVQRLDVVS